MFSCRARGFYPSCHAKRLEEWGEWMREELLLQYIGFNVHRLVRAKTYVARPVESFFYFPTRFPRSRISYLAMLK
jgi:hypothetical protein